MNTGWQNATIGNSVSRLGNNAGHPVGPNTLQKVMAGDVVAANVQYYYNTPPSSSANILPAMLGSLLQAMGGGAATALIHQTASNVTTQLTNNFAFQSAVQPPNSGGSQTPQAYLTVLFFDERFNLVEAQDGGVVQQQVASSISSAGSSIPLIGIKAPKNGYVYVYVSNQSNTDVYFDNLAVSITQSNLLEENHYYAYGLKIASISSRRQGDAYQGKTDNKYGMQGVFSELDDDIGWNDFALRNYDPQIGRWAQIDPYADNYLTSPYVGMGNNPVNVIDPSGGSIFDGVSAAGRAGICSLGGAIIGMAVDALSGGDGLKGAGIGALAGLGLSHGGFISTTAVVLQGANQAAMAITTGIIAQQAGNVTQGTNQTSTKTNYYFWMSELGNLMERNEQNGADNVYLMNYDANNPANDKYLPISDFNANTHGNDALMVAFVGHLIQNTGGGKLVKEYGFSPHCTDKDVLAYSSTESQVFLNTNRKVSNNYFDLLTAIDHEIGHLQMRTLSYADHAAVYLYGFRQRAFAKAPMKRGLAVSFANHLYNAYLKDWPNSNDKMLDDLIKQFNDMNTGMKLSRGRGPTSQAGLNLYLDGVLIPYTDLPSPNK